MDLATRKRKRKTPSQRKRGCKCEIHTQVCDGRAPDRIYTVTSREYDKASLEKLISMNVMSTRSKYVCSLCIDHGTRHRLQKHQGQYEIPIPNDNDQEHSDSLDGSSDDNGDEHIVIVEDATTQCINLADQLMEKLKTVDPSSNVVEEKMSELLAFIGCTIIRPSLQTETDKLKDQYLQIENLTNDRMSHNFLQKCNRLLVSFIGNVVGRNIETMDSLMMFRFGICIESIYHLQNGNLVLPHSFVSNLIQTTTSGSKTVTEVNAKILPGGSDTTYRTWLQLHGIDQLGTPDGDIDVYFDNIGKYIEKSYRVSADQKRTPTVISAVLNIPLKSHNVSSTPLQHKPELKPSVWNNVKNEKEVQKKMEEVITTAENNFRSYRFRYVAEIMDYMERSNEMETRISDLISTLNNSKYTRKCTQCSELHLPRKQKCSCGGKVESIETSSGNLSSFQDKIPKYFHIGEILDFNPSDTSFNEPIMLNPNSFTNIKSILDILKSSVIDSSNGREWVFIGADGPPYTIMRRIIEEQPEKYNWIILVSGKGHLNMNQMKTFFKVIDRVCGEFLGKDVLGFNTPKSYSYFIDCKDNHKSWQALEIFLHGTTMELVHLYTASLAVGIKATPLGFIEWQANVLNPTLKFMTQLTLNIALSIYVQRIGDRNNDEVCSNAGRYKFLNMFYAFNHPIYREIEYNDLRQKALYPDEIKDIRSANCTFSNVGSVVRDNHEGGDFKLENKNKCIKAIAPKGKKGEDMWKRIIRCTEDVTSVVKSGKFFLRLSRKQTSRRTPIENAIVKFRAYLRHKDFLTVGSSFVQNANGTRLNDALKNFPKILQEKRTLFWDMVASGTPMQSVRYENILVDAEDGKSTGDEEISCHVLTNLSSENDSDSSDNDWDSDSDDLIN